MYSVFLSSYTNTRESLGELEKAVETPVSFGGEALRDDPSNGCEGDYGNTRLRLVFPQHFSFSQTSSRVCITR